MERLACGHSCATVSTNFPTFPCLQRSPVPSAITPCPPPLASHRRPGFCLCGYASLDVHTTGMTQCPCCSFWLLALGVTFPAHMHVGACVSTSFTGGAEVHSIFCVHHIVSVHSSGDGHLNGFLFSSVLYTCYSLFLHRSCVRTWVLTLTLGWLGGMLDVHLTF